MTIKGYYNKHKGYYNKYIHANRAFGITYFIKLIFFRHEVIELKVTDTFAF